MICRETAITSVNRRRRGNVLIYTFFLLAILFAMVSLAVDFGHMQVIKTELQRCADATARGTIQEYVSYGSTTATAYSTTLAGLNSVDAKSGVSPTVAVTWGWWNSATSSFVAGSGTPVAVKVVVSRTTQTGNPIPLTFPLMHGTTIGRTTCDVWASAVATVNPLTIINYPSGFASASSSMSVNGSAFLTGSVLRVTPSSGNCAGTAWYHTPVPVSTFSTNFSFLLTNPNADGMAFVIQNVSKSAVGGTGGGLGYSGISNSLCVKFDLYNNSGEGTDSTGVFTGGAAPYTPATDMTPSGVNIHSGHQMNVAMTYDGTTLTWTVTDATTAATGTYSKVINIPGTVGSSSAYVGFTGGTGGSTAQQDILNWTYTVQGPLLTK